MKTKKLYRVLEGAFLVTLIAMIYILSIFSAKGQMSGDVLVAQDMSSTYLNESSFAQERIMKKSFRLLQKSSEFERIKQTGKSNASLDYPITEEAERQTILPLPQLDLRRRRSNEYLAPTIMIPLN